MIIKIAIGSDHAGVQLKDTIKTWLQNHKNYEIQDHGCFSGESVDYPDFAHPVASAIAWQEAAYGILFCGSANGMGITANKHKEVRAAVCWNEDLAALARQHNDANILCLPARFIELSMAKKITQQFLQSSFEGGRHKKRVNKINC